MPSTPSVIFPDFPLGSEAAMTLAGRELTRRGWRATHRLAGIYSAPDALAEGAAFAVTIFPRCAGPLGGGGDKAACWKLLISGDGRILVCPFARRCALRS